MEVMKTIRIGTRKSKLAMKQTELVVAAYKQLLPDYHYEIVPMSTKGDEQLNRSLSSFGGKGVFVTEIENAIREGTIDLAVHSGKDLPLPIADGLTIVATPQREDPRDVLVVKKEFYDKLAAANNMKGANVSEEWETTVQFLRKCRFRNVGTGSMRRQYQLHNLIGADVKEIRGNVPTRLAKLDTGEFDAVMLAAAGLKRLGLEKEEAYQYFYMEPTQFLPAPCQGIIAVEAREDDLLLAQYALIQDEATRHAFALERQVMEETGGSCKDVVGALALQTDANTMKLHMLFNGNYSEQQVLL
jgi:porphobilinogen deaminase